MGRLMSDVHTRRSLGAVVEIVRELGGKRLVQMNQKPHQPCV
jgi:hypothetical protein